MTQFEVKLGKTSVPGKPVTKFNVSISKVERLYANSEVEAISLAKSRNPGWELMDVKRL